MSISATPAAVRPRRAVRRVYGARAYEVTSPVPRAVWRELYRADPEAVPSQSPEWLDCVGAYRGWEDASRLYTFADGQQLLLPLVRRIGLPDPLSFRASLPPTWGVGGVIARREPTADDLAAVYADLAASPGLSVRILPNPRQGALWRAVRPTRLQVNPRRAHVLDLEGGFEEIWADRFAKNTRTAVRKALRAGVTIECDTTGRALPIFYRLYRLSVDRWASQRNDPRGFSHWRAARLYPLAKLQHVARAMGERFRVYVAWHEGAPVAASLLLLDRNADEIMAAMDKERASPVNANDLLQRTTIEDACRAGCRYYHLGDSGHAGIAHFKERFGALAYEYGEYYLERIPITAIDRGWKGAIKRLIGFSKG